MIWLGNVYLKLRAYSIAEVYLRGVQANNLALATCLAYQGNTQKCPEAIALCKELLLNLEPCDHADLMFMLAKALINNQQFDAAQKAIDKLISLDAMKANLVLAEMHRVEGNTEISLNVLLAEPYESCEYYLQLGQSYFVSKMYAESLVNLLKATKLEPYNCDCFYWLGCLYAATGDQTRATKCLEKCVNLHPQHENGVVKLSGIYRETQDFPSNLNILQNAVHAIPGGHVASAKWIWILLGFHYLTGCEYNEAIASFRTALRYDSNDTASWEGLADSYLQRGSLNSALRVYQKISELDDSNRYPKLQVANLKCTLRLHREAVDCYAELLALYPDFVPALKGIAEAHLGLSYHYFSNRLLGRSKDHAEQAVRYLTK